MIFPDHWDQEKQRAFIEFYHEQQQLQEFCEHLQVLSSNPKSRTRLIEVAHEKALFDEAARNASLSTIKRFYPQFIRRIFFSERFHDSVQWTPGVHLLFQMPIAVKERKSALHWILITVILGMLLFVTGWGMSLYQLLLIWQCHL